MLYLCEPFSEAVQGGVLQSQHAELALNASSLTASVKTSI